MAAFVNIVSVTSFGYCLLSKMPPKCLRHASLAPGGEEANCAAKWLKGINGDE